KGKLNKDGAIAKGERMSVSTYYNFKIFSDRVLFVIDTSGSMKWLESPPQRIDIAKKELFKAIKSLDAKTLFNVMTFSSDIHMWRKKGEVEASEDNIQDSLLWLKNRLLPRGGTNTYGALMSSIRDNPKVDTVFFLSDGLPSSGEMEVQEEILVALRDENRFRKVKFNTIALVFGKSKIEKAWKYEDPEEMGAFMRRIAEETGGHSVVITKPFFDLKD
ncbi:MAG: VWA domain-containing protein, partial [Planctomycetota bacterium]